MMIRRFGHPPKAEIRYTLRPGAYAVLMRGNDMLVTHQSEPEPEFQLPGGGIDPGEAPVGALHREVYEETGYTITKPTRLGTYRRFVFMPEYDMWAEKICSLYLARPAHRIGPPTEPMHEACWMPADIAIPMLANAGDQHFASQCVY